MSGPLFFDRVMAASTTTGTGTYTLGSTITGYQAWSAVGDGNTAYYCAVDVDVNGVPIGDWEVGLGTYTAVGTTLARTTVLASSNAGSAVNWAAGTRRIFLTRPATLGGGTVTTTGSPANGNLTKFTGATSISNADLTGDVTTSGGVATTLKTAAKTRQITYVANGGGSALTASATFDAYVQVEYDCTITANTVLADASGSVAIAITKSNFAGFPGSLTSIVASAPPTLSSAQSSTDSTLTGWTTSITAGDVLKFSISSATTVKTISCMLTVTV